MASIDDEALETESWAFLQWIECQVLVNFLEILQETLLLGVYCGSFMSGLIFSFYGSINEIFKNSSHTSKYQFLKLKYSRNTEINKSLLHLTGERDAFAGQVDINSIQRYIYYYRINEFICLPFSAFIDSFMHQSNKLVFTELYLVLGTKTLKEGKLKIYSNSLDLVTS